MMDGSSLKIKLLKARLPKIRLPQICLAFHQERNVVILKPVLKQQNGFSFKLENGKNILLEKLGTQAFEIKPPVDASNKLLLENDKNILLENGAYFNHEKIK